MNDLPMPSDVKAETTPVNADQPVVEPPSAKLIVRLFVIPALIVAAAVGVMLLIGALAGGDPTIEQAMARLKNPGGERTAEWLVGPGSKQRYMDAKALTDKMKGGMNEAERIELSRDLVALLKGGYVKPEEGMVQHFVLLALGRVWQIDPKQGPITTPAATAARAQAMATLVEFAAAKEPMTRKAALFAPVFWKGYDSEIHEIIPVMVARVRDEQEDTDVRMAAATALGPIGVDSPEVVEALKSAMGNTDPRQNELVLDAALSLAQLGHSDGEETLLKMLDREELGKMQYYDRESDPKNPSFRGLNEQEKQRIMINTMIGMKKLKSAVVKEKLAALVQNDPSDRVKWQAREVLQEMQ